MVRVRLTSFVILIAGVIAGIAFAARGFGQPPASATEIVILASAAQNGELVPCG